MKKYLVLPIAICATTFSFAAQSQIPEKYLGNWLTSRSRRSLRSLGQSKPALLRIVAPVRPAP
jgi:hypothetical protein